MLSDGDRAGLSDIAFNIDLAFTFAEGMNYERFADDLRTFYAVTRCLEIISEASRRLSPDLRRGILIFLGAKSPGRATYTVTTTKTSSIDSYGARSTSSCPGSRLWFARSCPRTAHLALRKIGSRRRSRCARLNVPEGKPRERASRAAFCVFLARSRTRVATIQPPSPAARRGRSGRSDPRSSPWSRPPRSPSQTSPSRPRCHRLPRARAVASASRK